MSKIHEFNPIIFPTRVWVIKGECSLDRIDRIFEAICDNGIIS